MTLQMGSQGAGGASSGVRVCGLGPKAYRGQVLPCAAQAQSPVALDTILDVHSGHYRILYEVAALELITEPLNSYSTIRSRSRGFFSFGLQVNWPVMTSPVLMVMTSWR